MAAAPKVSVVPEATEASIEFFVDLVADSVCGAVTPPEGILNAPAVANFRKAGIKLALRVSELFRTGGTVDVGAVEPVTLVASGVSVMVAASDACAELLGIVASGSACGSVAALKDALAPPTVSLLRDTDAGLELSREIGAARVDPIADPIAPAMSTG